jgi:hypothetical protein
MEEAMNETTPRKGDCVRLSAQARANGLRDTGRHGTCMGITSAGYAKVRWHGHKSAASYGLNLIERVPDDEPLPPEIERRFAHVEITQ